MGGHPPPRPPYSLMLPLKVSDSVNKGCSVQTCGQQVVDHGMDVWNRQFALYSVIFPFKEPYEALHTLGGKKIPLQVGPKKGLITNVTICSFLLFL